MFKRIHKSISFFVFVILATALTLPCSSNDENSLFVDLWYGDHQTFGRLGHSQRWINILGRVSPASNIKSLSYSLNGSDLLPLSFKADMKRIAEDGDFNIEIARALLLIGDNRVEIVAEDNDGSAIRRVATIEYVNTKKSWPIPYTIDWSKVDRIDDAVQVVDGLWTLTDHGVRSVGRYYDRILAFGDATWRNYEVTTSIIFHALTPPNSGPNNTGVSHAAIAVRWPGHDDDGLQPRVKWYPLGATAEFRIGSGLQQCRWRIFDGKREFYVESDRRRTIKLGDTYRMKHRVETLEDGRSHNRAKLWLASEPEPGDWDIERFESGDLPGGSALLIAHHTDVTFGNVSVVPVSVNRSETNVD